jgi:hypothetical protein
VEGNDQAVTAMRETWHSQESGINLLSIRSEPIVGKQTFTITELSAADPDSHPFKVPAGYTVTDLRTSSPKNDRPPELLLKSDSRVPAALAGGLLSG